MKQTLISFMVIVLFISSGCSSRTSSNSNQNVNETASSEAYITNTGSDTIVNLALAWAEEYQSLYPNVRISVSGGGSGTGIAALINRTVDIANASRKIKAEEIAQAKKNGVDPKEFIIAKDAIAVIVNLGNPVNQLTLQQVSDIYSGKINNWSEVGGEDRPIVRLSRETNSGTHVYFLENVLRMGNKDDKTLFATNTLLLPSSQGIISETRDNPNAIGYDGLGYITPEVKVVAIAKSSQEPYVLPSIQSVNDNSYPIARDLYMYTAGDPTGAIKNYLAWIMSLDADKIVSELGFVPISR